MERQRNYAGASNLYRKILAENSDDHQAWASLGKLYVERGHPAGAILFFERAVEADPNRERYRLSLANALWRSRRIASCLQACADAESAGCAGPGFRYHRALCEKRRGNKEAALEAIGDLRSAGSYEGRFLAFCDDLETEKRGAEKRIALYFRKPFGYWVLKPVFEALKGMAGNQADLLFSADQTEVANFAPHVAVVCEAPTGGFRKVLDRTVFVHVRHGLAEKHGAVHFSTLCDYACMPGEMSRERLLSAGTMKPEQVWITGYAQMDLLFRKETPSLSFELDKKKKTVLYAPTFNPGLSSLPLVMRGTSLKQQLLGAVKDEVNLLVKPHPNVFEQLPAWILRLQEMTEETGVFFNSEAPGADLSPYLAAADLLITDASSAALMYLALDRPIIQITNPNHKDDKAYRADGLEWIWRDMGAEVAGVRELHKAVKRALTGTDGHEEKRAKYRKELFDDLTDGRAGERIAEKVLCLETIDKGEL